MSDTYQIVFLKAGDGSPASLKAVAEKIAHATRSAPEQILKQLERAPFIYKKGLPRAKAENVAAALNKLGATTEVRPEGAGAQPGVAARPAPVAAAAGSSGAGFDFGAAPVNPGSSGQIPGYDFDSAPPPSGSGIPASGFEGFGFGAPPATPGTMAAGRPEDFSIEEPSGSFSALKAPAPAAPATPAVTGAPPAAGFSGFNFSAEAATTGPAKKAAVSDVAVSRNEDYAADAPSAPAAPPPPKQHKKKTKAAAATVLCPRCQVEVPVANECGNCGVVLSKAGEAGASGAPRRRGPAAVAQKKSPLLYAGVVAIALVAIAAGAFFGGLLNPIRLKMDAGANVLLKQYAVTVAPPRGRFAEGLLTDPARAQDIQQGFLDRSKAIEDEINRLSGLAKLSDFDQGARALDAEAGEYVRSPGKLLLDEISKVVGPYYPVQGAGLRKDGVTYMFTEVIELTGSKDDPQVTAILSDAQIRERLKVGRERVVAAEAQRLAAERASSSDVSFTDGFDSGLADRWQKPQGSAMAASGGKLRIIGQRIDAPQAPRLVTSEPDADYMVKVTVSGGGGDTRGGLIVLTSQGFISVVKIRKGAGDFVALVTERGEAGSSPAGRDVQLRLEMRAGQYTASFWNGAKGTWAELGRAQPGWADPAARQPGHQLGLTAFGGASTFEFDDFNLTVAQ